MMDKRSLRGPSTRSRIHLAGTRDLRVGQSKILIEALERRLMFSTVIYSNDFQNAVGSEWSKTITDTTPSGRKFLGQFSGGNNGFMNGGATWTSGRSGRNSAVALDGSTGYVTIGSDDTLVNLNGAVTISLWVKFNSVSGTPVIIDTEGAGASPGPGFQLGVDSGKLYFEVRSSAGTAYNNKSASGGTTLMTGTWYQITGTFSGGVVTTYVNGSQDRQATPGGTLNSITPPIIGKRKGGTGSGAKWLSGTVDDLQIFNRALSGSEVSSLPDGASTGLIAYLKMDENTGSRLQDIAGASGVKLSLNNIPTHSQLTVSFDLFTIHSWDGRSTGIYGPDIWTLTQDGSTLLNSTFANGNVSGQSYPGTYPGGNNPKQTGASEVNTLGYGSPSDAVYHLSYTFSHTSSSVVFYFNATNLQGLDDESWGIDNVTLSRDTTAIVTPSIDFQESGIAPGVEEDIGQTVRVNDDFDEGNHDASGALVSDLQPDATAGDRISAVDDELVDGWLYLSQDAGTGGNWKLDYPSNVKIWREASPGVWTVISSGQWSSAVFGSATINLKVEGISAGSVVNDVAVVATFNSVGSTTTHTAVFTVAPHRLAAPSDLAASINNLGTATLTWTANTELDVQGYNVYRSIGGGSYELLNEYVLFDNSYSDSSAPAGELATYHVTAVDWSGVESDAASVTATRPSDSTAPNNVTSLGATATPDGVTLTWTASTSADVVLYRVYPSGSPLDPDDSIGSVFPNGSSSLSFFDLEGIGKGAVSYCVTVVDQAGNESSGATVSISTSAVDKTAPDAPSTITVSRDSGGTYTIDWDDNVDSDLAGYRVYRSDSVFGDYQPLTSDPIPSSQFVDDSVPVTDTAYYRVSAIDTRENESITVGTDTSAPNAPASLTASTGTDGVTLSWSGSTSSDLQGYLVYSGVSSSGPFEWIGFVDATQNTFLDGDAAQGSTVYYRVVAMDSSRNLSSPATTSIAVALATPGHFSADIASSNQINLHWDATPWSGVTWGLYRDTNASFTPSAGNLLASGLADSAYVDQDLGTWTTYYYRLIAATGSTQSDPTAAVEVDNSSPALPNAPALASLTPGTAAGDLVLSWDGDILNELGYQVERFNENTEVWDLLGQVPVNARSFTITDADLNVSETYRVFAFNSSGNGSAIEAISQ